MFFLNFPTLSKCSSQPLIAAKWKSMFNSYSRCDHSQSFQTKVILLLILLQRRFLQTHSRDEWNTITEKYSWILQIAGRICVLIFRTMHFTRIHEFAGNFSVREYTFIMDNQNPSPILYCTLNQLNILFSKTISRNESIAKAMWNSSFTIS